MEGLLGTLNGPKANIYVEPNTEPKYMKACAVPYTLKAKVEQELERLQGEGIISPVEFSEWAAPIIAPIIPVVKSNGSLRICEDYKCTVNQASKLDNYPIPKTEDLLATLDGGNKFTKLDMSQAYQQLPLEEDSRNIQPSIHTRDSILTIDYPLGFLQHQEYFSVQWIICCKGYLMWWCASTTYW